MRWLSLCFRKAPPAEGCWGSCLRRRDEVYGLEYRTALRQWWCGWTRRGRWRKDAGGEIEKIWLTFGAGCEWGMKMTPRCLWWWWWWDWKAGKTVRRMAGTGDWGCRVRCRGASVSGWNSSMGDGTIETRWAFISRMLPTLWLVHSPQVVKH